MPADKPRPGHSVPEMPPFGGVSAEYPIAQAARLISRFDIPSPIEVYDFAEKGNINRHTFLIESGRRDCRRQFLLQQINQQVFVRPDNVMAAMIAAIEAQKANLAGATQDPVREWEPIALVPLRSGEPYLCAVDRKSRTCWRLMVKIADATTFKSLGEIEDPVLRLAYARETGKGLAIFSDLTSTIDAAQLTNPLPGYRDSLNYFDQFASILAGSRTIEQAREWIPDEPLLRQSTQEHFLVHIPEDAYRARLDDPALQSFIELARAEREFGLTFARELKSGSIRTVAVHGDTKLENFLFSATTGRVKALVDLDTIMPHTWLSDWGDMARSLVNVAGEKEPNLDRVRVDRDIYRALAAGFLATSRAVTEHEVSLMVDAVKLVALELGVRFLTDYLRGDTYFQLGPADPPDLNKTRAMVQLTLFKRLREAEDECRSFIASARQEASS